MAKFDAEYIIAALNKRNNERDRLNKLYGITSEYINKVANSENEKDHLHLDDLTLIDSNSEVKNLIIEKI